MTTGQKISLAILALVNIIVAYWGENRSFMYMGLINGLFPIYIKLFNERITPKIKTLDQFCWQWKSLIIYGSLFIFVSLQLVGVVAGILVGLVMALAPLLAIFRNVQQMLPPTIVVTFVLWGVPLFYVSGRLIGRRTTPHVSMPKGMISVGVATVLAMIVSFGLNMLIVGDSELRQLNSKFLEINSDNVFRILGVLFALLVVTPPVLYGYWRGRRQTVSAYMGYILSKLRANEQQTIVTLAYDAATAEKPS